MYTDGNSLSPVYKRPIGSTEFRENQKPEVRFTKEELKQFGPVTPFSEENIAKDLYLQEIAKEKIKPITYQKDDKGQYHFEYPKESTKTNFEQRIQNPIETIKNPDGTTSTHKMMSWESDGKYYAAPTIVEQNGKLVELTPDAAIDYAFKNNEFKEFKTDQEAKDYANNGYKVGTPMDIANFNEYDRAISEGAFKIKAMENDPEYLKTKDFQKQKEYFKSKGYSFHSGVMGNYNLPRNEWVKDPLGTINIEGREVPYYSEDELQKYSGYKPTKVGASNNYTISRFESPLYWEGDQLMDKKTKQVVHDPSSMVGNFQKGGQPILNWFQKGKEIPKGMMMTGLKKPNYQAADNVSTVYIDPKTLKQQSTRTSGTPSENLDKRGSIKLIENFLFNNIDPQTGDDYEILDAASNIFKTAVTGGLDKPLNNKFIDDDFFSKYLNIPYNKDVIQDSPYTPTTETDTTSTYSRLNPKFINPQNILDFYFNKSAENKSSAFHSIVPSSGYSEKAIPLIGNESNPQDIYMKDYTIMDPLRNVKYSTGKDNKGEYLSIYDVYDLKSNPLEGFIGEPYEIYDRLYYNPETKKHIPEDKFGGESIWDNAHKQFAEGGETTIALNIYKDYVDGIYDGTPEENHAKRVFDRLNTKHLHNARKQGMSPANYVMTNLLSLNKSAI
jgi:hypothetical protein